MSFHSKNTLFKAVTNEWFIGLILLLVFLATNGYKYGWDDQHLEIPLLKSLIDPTLYVGDYYVESLKENFTSWLFPILSRLIHIDQIPMTYLYLFILSRFFLFFFIYKIWLYISSNKPTAFLCTLTIMLLGRVEEFLYRTFSHQEFALAIIFWGIYLFYKERFLWASIVLGLAANFHVLYSLFPFCYLAGYLVFFHPKDKFRLFSTSVILFLISALPIICWVGQKQINLIGVFDKFFYKDWMALYKIACPQNFIFYDNTLKEVLNDFALFVKHTRAYWLLVVFFMLNIFFNHTFRTDKKSLAVIIFGFLLLLISFVFTYIFPSRFALDLNLVRNMQYMLFILMGFTTILLFQKVQEEPLWLAIPLSLAFSLIRFGDYISTFAGTLMLSLFWLKSVLKNTNERHKGTNVVFLTFAVTGAVLSVAGILHVFSSHPFSKSAKISQLVIFILIGLTGIALIFLKRHSRILRKTLIIIPFFILFCNFIYYHYIHIKIEKTAPGFWQLQRNWEDMQRYVKAHVPKDAQLLVPYDMEMGGFRILSERKIIVSYRDCGIVGFNYEAGKEWQARIKDIEPFKVFIDKPITPAIMNAIFKYQANYIIFMRYMDPGRNDILEPIYHNDIFALYHVLRNPVSY